MNPSTLPERLPLGATVRCRVVRVENFGVIVRVEGESELGLIRPSEWAWSGRQADLRREAQRHPAFSAKVVGHGDSRHRQQMVYLSRRQTLPNPLAEFRRRHKVGDVVRAEVKFVTQHGGGVLVGLGGGVDGFVPKAELPAFVMEVAGYGLLENDPVEAEILGFRDPGADASQPGEVRLSIARRLLARSQAAVAGASSSSLGFHPKVGPLLENLALNQQIQDVPMPVLSDEARERFRRILVVENDEAVSESLDLALGLFDLECRRAGSIETALEVLAESEVDLILLDLNLEREKGLGLLERFRGHLGATRVILLTGTQEIDWDHVVGQKEQFAAILQKPSSLQRIFDILDALAKGLPVDDDDHLDGGYGGGEEALHSLARSPLGTAETFDIARAVDELKVATRADRAALFAYRPGPIFELKGHAWPALDPQAQRELDLSPIGDLLREGGATLVADTRQTLRRFGHLQGVGSFAGIRLDFRDSAVYGLVVTAAKSHQLAPETPHLLEKLALRLDRALMERRFQTVLSASQGQLLTGLLASSLLHEVKNAAQALGPFSLIQTRLAQVRDLDFASFGPQELVLFKRSILGIERVAGDLTKLVGLFRDLAGGAAAEVVDLRQVFQQLRPLLKPLADQFRVTVEEPETFGKIPPLKISPQLLDQALLNLIMNAVEQTGVAGGTVKSVLLSARYLPDDDYPVRIEVRDTGPGIHHVDRERIFDPFFSTKDKGTGLGLSIARLFVERLGGRLTLAETTLFLGSTFRIELPKAALR